MADARADSRAVVQHLVSGLCDGDGRVVSSCCAPDVRWWTPLGDVELRGPAEVLVALRQVLARIGPPVEVLALAVAEDGSRAVVELTASSDATAESTLVTSVLDLDGGRITQGRTYLDVEALRDVEVLRDAEVPGAVEGRA